MRIMPKILLCCCVVLVASLLALPGLGNIQIADAQNLNVSIVSPANRSAAFSPVEFVGRVGGGQAPFTFRWILSNGAPDRVTTTTMLRRNTVAAAFPLGTQRARLQVTDANGASGSASIQVLTTPAPPGTVALQKSINSTSANRATQPPNFVNEEPLIGSPGYQVLAANDLGMHCGDLDHRVASILPPFNVIHAQVIRKGEEPVIQNENRVEVFYSAASNPKDPALQRGPSTPIFKTNFWATNPRTGNILAFDGYDPFYPPGILGLFPLTVDIGLPVPDVERLFLGDGLLVADQQSMPGVAGPYVVNTPQRFARFDRNLPFFINFPFGYTLRRIDWFAADGIPITPFDDAGRNNSFPLMRVQAKRANGRILASLDTVVPVSAEADCFACHTSSVDGGNGEAACIPGQDPNCNTEGAPRAAPVRLRPGTAFDVVTATEDPARGTVPSAVSREWAADLNIVRLHDAKFGTALETTTPVVCQRCHYTPALDLAQVGPLGPGDADANGREQRIHQSNSRVLHFFHGRLRTLFADDMPPPNDPLRTNPATGEPVVNAFVNNKLNQSCYQCHPGKVTQCLRGAMFNGGLICQDCHGNMLQVGDDFSRNFSVATPFPAGANLNKRIPWATEPGCQSCHTGDALNNLGQTDPNVIPAADGIRLLQAYRTNDPNATPISAPASRFAENRAGGQRVLYRLSKDNHAGIFCEACHGSTHAEWPVQPESGTFVANDNLAAIRLQGHTGTVIECTTCHTAGTLPVALDGPHGIHPVNDQNWVDGHEEFIQNFDDCRSCHGVNGEGTVLSRVAADRTLQAEDEAVTLTKGQLVSCDICHENPIGVPGD